MSVELCVRWSAPRLLSPGARSAGLDWLDLLDLHHGVFSPVRGRQQEEDEEVQRTGQGSVSWRESGGGEL